MSRTGSTDDREVVAIVGAGPVGLSLAVGLARHGVRSVLMDRKPATNTQSRAPAIHLRSLEIFRQWGVDEPLLESGTLKRSLALHRGPTSRQPLMSFPFGDLDEQADRAGVLFLEQAQTEQLLLAALRASGMCDVRFSTEAVALEPADGGVRLTIREASAERWLDARFVVGCDGASSFVRTALELPFDGITYPLRPTLADVLVDDGRDTLPWPRFHNGRSGLTSALRLAPRRWRIIRVEAGSPAPGEPVGDQEVRQRAAEVLGDGPVEVLWASRFKFQRRASPRYRQGRVLLAGDAAHVFPPANGQGMNAGIQDVHNLAWKLAHALRGGNTERLLDSYDVERRAIVGTVSRHVSLLTRVGIQSPRAVRAAVIQLIRLALAMPPSRTERLRNMAMIDLDLAGSPLLDLEERSAGVRLPNPTLHSPDGSTMRLYDLLPIGSALLDLAPGRSIAEELPVEATIMIGRGSAHDPTGSLGALLGGAPGWILVRPDRHVAWARTDPAGLAAATRHALGLDA